MPMSVQGSSTDAPAISRGRPKCPPNFIDAMANSCAVSGGSEKSPFLSQAYIVFVLDRAMLGKTFFYRGWTQMNADAK